MSGTEASPNYGYPDDDFIQIASYALNVNLAPVFEFWGVPASAPLVSDLATLPPADAFKERLKFYLTLVPTDRDDYVKSVTRLRSTTGSVGRWDYYLANYDAVYSQIMGDKVERILSSITVKPVWPSQYSGVATDNGALGLAFNNIGEYNAADATIYTCVRILAERPSRVSKRH